MYIVKNHLIKYLVLVLFPRYPNKKLYRIYLKQLPNNQDDSTFEKKKKTVGNLLKMELEKKSWGQSVKQMFARKS